MDEETDRETVIIQEQSVGKDNRTTMYVLGKLKGDIATMTKKRILVTRLEESEQQPPGTERSMKSSSSKRVLVTRLDNPIPQPSSSKCDTKKTKTISGTLNPQKKDMFVLKASNSEIKRCSNQSVKKTASYHKKIKKLLG